MKKLKNEEINERLTNDLFVFLEKLVFFHLKAIITVLEVNFEDIYNKSYSKIKRLLILS
jgi:hypothetical protein